MANVADGATGTVLTAPSPATSGTSVVLNAGEGYRFPAVPFFAIMHPNNTIPTVSTAEKVQVTAQGQTTIAVGSNGASLPQSTINVVDTTSLPTSGSVTILNNAGTPQLITYTGKTGTTLTGASGGTGTLATGGVVMGDNFTIVRAISPYSAQTVVATWRFSNAIFANDLNNASIVKNEVPVGLVNGSNTAFTTASQYQGKTLMVYKNGIRLKGNGNDYTETAGGFTMTTAPATGTVLLVDYFIGGTINNIGTNSLITDETPSGTVNSSNTAFTAARPYIAGQLEVFINGVKQKRGTHYTESSPTTGGFTMSDAPLTGDDIMINYAFNLNPASNSDTVDGFHASSTPQASTILPLDSASKFPASVMTPTMWWEEIGRGTLLSAAGSLNVAFSARKYLYIIIQSGASAANTTPSIQVNGDTTANYAARHSTDGGADATQVNQSSIPIVSLTYTAGFWAVMEMFNTANLEKHVIFRATRDDPGVGAAMVRREGIFKWGNSSVQATSIQLVTAANTFPAGTEMIVLGHD